MRIRPISIVVAASLLAISPGALAQKAATLSELELEGKLHERAGALDWLTGGRKHHTLRDVVTAIKHASTDADLNGIVIRLKDAQLTASQVEEIGEAAKAFRAAGKKIHVFSDSYETSGLLLGSFADGVYAQAGGPVSFIHTISPG